MKPKKSHSSCEKKRMMHRNIHMYNLKEKSCEKQKHTLNVKINDS